MAKRTTSVAGSSRPSAGNGASTLHLAIDQPRAHRIHLDRRKTIERTPVGDLEPHFGVAVSNAANASSTCFSSLTEAKTEKPKPTAVSSINAA